MSDFVDVDVRNPRLGSLGERHDFPQSSHLVPGNAGVVAESVVVGHRKLKGEEIIFRRKKVSQLPGF